MLRLTMFSILATSVFTSAVTVAQDIYKTYDENGNVVYTDQPPNENAEPLELAPITVVEAFKPIQPEAPVQPDPQPLEDIELYSNFIITSPTEDENLWGTGGKLTAAAQSDQTLRRGDSVRFYIDGELQTQETSFVAELTDIFRGEHQLIMEIVDSKGIILASAGPVTFHMKQQSIQNPNAPGNSAVNAGSSLAFPGTNANRTANTRSGG